MVDRVISRLSWVGTGSIGLDCVHCPRSHLEGELLMRDERATRVALAISWWKMQGVLASSR